MDESRVMEVTNGAFARALTVQRGASSVGFDWSEVTPVFAKVLEEVEEIREALAHDQREHAKDELGDLLFAVVNLARFLDADPADALDRTTDRFERRFARVCDLVSSEGKTTQDCTLEELDAAWETAKRESLTTC